MTTESKPTSFPTRTELIAALHPALHDLGVRIPALERHPGDHCNLVANVIVDLLLTEYDVSRKGSQG